MNACLGITCHLHFWQNYRGLLHATAITQGWNRHRVRVSTQSWLWRRKFSCHSCWDSNLQPFDYKSGALTNMLSWRTTAILTVKIQKHISLVSEKTKLHLHIHCSGKGSENTEAWLTGLNKDQFIFMYILLWHKQWKYRSTFHWGLQRESYMYAYIAVPRNINSESTTPWSIGVCKDKVTFMPTLL